MRLARKDNLYGTVRIVEDAAQAIHIAEDEGGSLIRGKTTCKADSESVWIEHVLKFGHLDSSLTQPQVLLLQAAANVSNQRIFPLHMRLPQFLVGNDLHTLP